MTRAVTIVAPGGAVFEIHSPIARNQPASYNGVGARPRRIEHVNAFSPDARRSATSATKRSA